MRTLAIGDIHGCLTAFETLLEVVAPTQADRIITLGDIVDRGPDACQVIDRLLELDETGQLIPLRGNHDEMMLLSRHDRTERRMWLRFGGAQTLASYGHHVHDEEYDRVPQRHWQFLEHRLRHWHETENHIFVHANVDPLLPMVQQDPYDLLWRRLDDKVAHCSGKTLIVGHTRQLSGLPLDLDTVVCIDTGIYELEGWLTCLHVESGQFWQANQRGQVREATLRSMGCLRS